MTSTMSEYQIRKAKMLAYLGGKCVNCSSTEALQFDHIDPKTKSFGIMQNWAISWNRLVVELDKCQLLCKLHHIEKTKINKEYGGGHNKWEEIQHGTPWGYSKYGCRCDSCKKAKSEAGKKYNKNKRDVAQRKSASFGN